MNLRIFSFSIYQMQYLLFLALVYTSLLWTYLVVVLKHNILLSKKVLIRLDRLVFDGILRSRYAQRASRDPLQSLFSCFYTVFLSFSANLSGFDYILFFCGILDQLRCSTCITVSYTINYLYY